MSTGTIARAQRLNRPAVLTGAVVALFAAWLASGIGGPTIVRTVDDFGTGVAAAVAAAACLRTARRHTGRLRLVWSLLAAASASWALGELTWSIYDLAQGSVPAPSWADVGFLAALPPMAVALLVHPALRSRAIGQARTLLDGLVLATALALLMWTLVLEPLQKSSSLSTLGGAVAAAYPLGDVVVIFLVVLVIRGTTGGDRLDLWCLLFGLLAITMSDSLFGYLVDTSNYGSGNVFDTGWFAGYLAIALGAYFARSGSRPREAFSTRLSTAALIGPFLPLLAALCLAAIKVELGHRLDRVSIALAFTLVSCVLLRQVLLVVDLVRPQTGEADVANRFLAAVGEAAPSQSSPNQGSRT